MTSQFDALTRAAGQGNVSRRKVLGMVAAFLATTVMPQLRPRWAAAAVARCESANADYDPATQACCNGVVCGRDETCCAGATTGAGSCCGVGETCTNGVCGCADGRGFCGPAQTCCPPETQCITDEGGSRCTCKQDRACGSQCCAPGQVCTNVGDTSRCDCESGATCGALCCPPGSVCKPAETVTMRLETTLLAEEAETQFSSVGRALATWSTGPVVMTLRNDGSYHARSPVQLGAYEWTNNTSCDMYFDRYRGEVSFSAARTRSGRWLLHAHLNAALEFKSTDCNGHPAEVSFTNFSAAGMFDTVVTGDEELRWRGRVDAPPEYYKITEILSVLEIVGLPACDCGPGLETCGSNCCPSGQCADPETGRCTCPPERTYDGDKCCPPGQIASGIPSEPCTCAVGDQPCGDTCCTSPEVCLDDANGVCGCATGTERCGSVCCPTGECADPAEGTCACPDGKRRCGDTCCPEGQCDEENGVCRCEDADRACGELCCAEGEYCSRSGDQEVCCKDGTSSCRVGPSDDFDLVCCPPGQVCRFTEQLRRDQRTRTCCPEDRACESYCCAGDEVCTGLLGSGLRVVCCAEGRAVADRSRCCTELEKPCGNTCCPDTPYYTCYSNRVCCGRGFKPCGDRCCPETSTCCDGTCCAAGAKCTPQPDGSRRCTVPPLDRAAERVEQIFSRFQRPRPTTAQPQPRRARTRSRGWSSRRR